MIKESQLRPNAMKDLIYKMKDDGRFFSENKYLAAWRVSLHPLPSEWQIEISHHPVEVQSTQLFPPAILYRRSEVQPTKNGILQWNLAR